MQCAVHNLKYIFIKTIQQIIHNPRNGGGANRQPTNTRKKNQDNKITTHNSIRMRTTEKHTKTQRPKINGNNNNI